MRKHHQKQILELIGTLAEAHTEIRRLLSADQLDAAIGLLSDCQEVAARIGKFIEELAGEGTKTVAYLEEYCELLYRVAADVSGNVGDKRRDSISVKSLQKQLIETENSVRTDLKPDRIEMVFLPYKASMFDAMESIWLAAKDDPACDAYVIPIPYYDKLPGGTPGRMHCEIGDYPEYVPVVDWQKYSIEERRPDVIVIHNPYDDGNLVTGIHPDFYSERLKKLTDLLVYVPYFVCVDDVPEHFCTCVGVLNADRVIVQSEKVRNTYIRVFRAFEKAHNCKGRFGRAETKFVVLGSPKFDRVLSASREDREIPDEWRKLIENPDGTRKKVVLYNTSVGAILAENEKMLNKLRYVFDCFRNRDDAVLLWRPHPLNEATYRAMRPELARKYAEIVAEYKNEGFGIYDDTPDPYRAITVSDAYYGDGGSSIVALYQATGKPVMIQNAETSDDEGIWNKLAFSNLYDDGDSFWFTAVNFNGLFKMDRETWEAEYMGSFPGERMNQYCQYGGIAGRDGKLYFAPLGADAIGIYDVNAKRFDKVLLSVPNTQTKLKRRDDQKFISSTLYNNSIFFFPNTSSAILRYGITSSETEYYSDWVAPLERLMHDADDIYFLHSIVVDDSLIVAAACCANAVVMFNMKTTSSVVYKVGRDGYGYSGICFDGNDYWLAPRHDGPIVRWNSEMNACREYTDYPAGFSGARGGFCNINYAGGYVWLFPFLANMALKINPRDGHILAADEFQIGCENKNTRLFKDNCILSRTSGERLYVHTNDSRRFIEFNCETGRRCDEAIAIPDEATGAAAGARMLAFQKDAALCKNVYDCFYYESPFRLLPAFIDWLARADGSESANALRERSIGIFRETVARSDGTSGAAIYALCRRNVLPVSAKDTNGDATRGWMNRERAT
jgi:hypothetical protein